MMDELNNIINAGYKPNHDDGVPVTSCPLVKLIAHRGWKQECTENWEDLQKGEYDWSFGHEHVPCPCHPKGQEGLVPRPDSWT